MLDRRSRRIREQLRQNPNPRAGQPSRPLPFEERIRQVYLKAQPQPALASDVQAQLAQRLQRRLRNRR